MTDNSAPRKFDQDKPQVNLIPTIALIEMGKVLAFGAKKYDRGNWAKGLATSRYYDAATRHLLAWNEGEDKDPESGLSHLAHAAVNLCFMLWNMAFREDLDDRWQPKFPEQSFDEGTTITGKPMPQVVGTDRGWWTWFIIGNQKKINYAPVFARRELCVRWDVQDSQDRGLQHNFADSTEYYELVECDSAGNRIKK